LIEFAGNASLFLTNTNLALIQAAQRANYPRGALTPLYIEGGADSWSLVYSDAYIATLQMGLDEGGAVKCDIDWKALSCADGDGLTPADETADVFEDYEFVSTIDGTEYGILQWSINLDNHIAYPKGNQDSKTAGTYRYPQYLLVGMEDLTVEVTCGRPIARAVLDLWSDETEEDVDIVLVGNNGVNTLTITLDALKPNRAEGFGLVAPDDQAKWTYGFRGKSSTGSLTIAIT